jgi:hypothetical protein
MRLVRDCVFKLAGAAARRLDHGEDEPVADPCRKQVDHVGSLVRSSLRGRFDVE